MREARTPGGRGPRGGGAELASARSLREGERTRGGRIADRGTGRRGEEGALTRGRDSLRLGGADSGNRGEGGVFSGIRDREEGGYSGGGQTAGSSREGRKRGVQWVSSGVGVH